MVETGHGPHWYVLPHESLHVPHWSLACWQHCGSGTQASPPLLLLPLLPLLVLPPLLLALLVLPLLPLLVLLVLPLLLPVLPPLLPLALLPPLPLLLPFPSPRMTSPPPSETEESSPASPDVLKMSKLFEHAANSSESAAATGTAHAGFIGTATFSRKPFLGTNLLSRGAT